MIGDPVERFDPTSGRFTGALGVVLAAVLLVVGVVSGWALWALGIVVLALVLSWAALLRPVVRIDHHLLVMRSMLSTTELPLAAVEDVVVRQVLAVRVGEKRHVSPAVGRRLRQMMRNDLTLGVSTNPGAPTDERDLVDLADNHYADYVEVRLRQAAEAERERLGLDVGSPELAELATQVRRSPAVPELVVLGVGVVLVVVGIVLA